MTEIKTNKGTFELPAGVTLSDLKYPSWKSSKRFDYSEVTKLGLDHSDLELDFWYVNSIGWCLPTLLIHRAGRRSAPGTTDRTYAVGVNGNHYRIGHGPHVQAEVKVYVNKANLDRLRKYIDLRKSGAVHANETRDRISTRRMNTMNRRSSLFGF